MACPFAILSSAFTMKVPSTHITAAADHHRNDEFIHEHTKALPHEDTTSHALTSILKDATWAAHRAIERSPGVAALMGTSLRDNPSSCGSHYSLERIDYVRFLVMLLCVYAPMEAAMLEENDPATLPPAFDDLTKPMLRTPALLHDIQDHIDELCGQPSSSAAELLSYTEPERATSSSLDAKRCRLAHHTSTALQVIAHQTKCSHQLEGELEQLIGLLHDRQVLAASAYAERVAAIACLGGSNTSCTKPFMPNNLHDSLHRHYDEGVSLTPTSEHPSPSPSRTSSPRPALPSSLTQNTSSSTFSTADSGIAANSIPYSIVTRVYSAMTTALATRIGHPASTEIAPAVAIPDASHTTSLTNNGDEPCLSLLVAHIYVRYMGDLSGGQHMVKRLSKLFPLDGADSLSGFRFYSFVDGPKLKSHLRAAIDGMQLSPVHQDRLAQEASLAFDLNRGILDSLVTVDIDVLAS